MRIVDIVVIITLTIPVILCAIGIFNTNYVWYIPLSFLLVYFALILAAFIYAIWG